MPRVWVLVTLGPGLLAGTAEEHDGRDSSNQLASGTSSPRSHGGELVFSVKTWQGDYTTKDLPGGVASTSVVGAIYSRAGDGDLAYRFPGAPPRTWPVFTSFALPSVVGPATVLACLAPHGPADRAVAANGARNRLPTTRQTR
ncbi:MAG TPA: hypothetical protein VFA18_12250 [Gemmataceae bacterium]|nr:hypothetical protein [Gemmataceae bacterium]